MNHQSGAFSRFCHLDFGFHLAFELCHLALFAVLGFVIWISNVSPQYLYRISNVSLVSMNPINSMNSMNSICLHQPANY